MGSGRFRCLQPYISASVPLQLKFRPSPSLIYIFVYMWHDVSSVTIDELQPANAPHLVTEVNPTIRLWQPAVEASVIQLRPLTSRVIMPP